MTRDKRTDPRAAHQPEVEHPALVEALIQAAGQLLAEHPPEEVTPLRIATRAGVSLTTLMRYVQDKDAILAEAMERRRRAQSSRVAAPPRTSSARPAVPPPPPPPASMLFRSIATRRHEDSAAAPAMFRLPDAPSAPAPASKPAPPEPPAPPQTLEQALSPVVRQLVSTFAELLPAIPTMPQGDRDAITRVELKRMAKAFEAVLARHQVPQSPHVAHVLTLSCDKVIKDAMRHAPESFTDGRLEQSLCRLCLDFIRS